MVCRICLFLSCANDSSPVGEPVIRNRAALDMVHGYDEKMNSWLFCFKRSWGFPGLGMLRNGGNILGFSRFRNAAEWWSLCAFFTSFPFAERRLLPLVGGYQALLSTPD